MKMMGLPMDDLFSVAEEEEPSELPELLERLSNRPGLAAELRLGGGSRRYMLVFSELIEGLPAWMLDCVGREAISLGDGVVEEHLWDVAEETGLPFLSVVIVNRVDRLKEPREDAIAYYMGLTSYEDFASCGRLSGRDEVLDLLVFGRST